MYWLVQIALSDSKLLAEQQDFQVFSYSVSCPILTQSSRVESKCMTMHQIMGRRLPLAVDTSFYPRKA